MKKNFTCAIALMVLALAALGQTKTYTGIKKFYGSGLQAITENNEVKGYYMFGAVDKVSKKENIYQLIILDNNLSETHSVEFKKSNNLSLLESSFNGECFCFAFVDYRAQTIEYMLLGKDGKEVGAYVIKDVSSSELQMMQSSTQSEDYLYSGGLAAVSGKGFVRYGIEKEKGFRMSMEMFDNNGTKKWSTNSGAPLTSKSYELAVPFYSDDKNVVTLLSSREKAFTQEMSQDVIGHDVETGKELFRVKGDNPKYNLLPEGVSYDASTGEFFIYGEYAKPKDIVSLGIYIQVVGKDGKVSKESFSTWTGDIFKATPGPVKAKTEKNTYIAIHKIVRTADGRFYAIGEQFKKALSGLGVASAVLGGGNGNGVALSKIEVFNMMIYQFDPALKITSVEMVEKDKTNVQLPQGLGVNGPTTLGYYLRLTGGFDYAYTAVSPDRKKFNVAYVNYDRDKDEGNKFVVGNIVYNEQKLLTDKVDLSSKASAFWVRPAKPGYVCIFEYFRKAKKLDIRLEKLNM